MVIKVIRNMKTLYLVLLFCFLKFSLYAQRDYKHLNNETYTYQETTAIYEGLAQKHKQAKLIEVGISDAGKPIHLFVIANDGDFDFKSIKNKKKAVLMINNAIHPGEPCGVDASIKFADELLNSEKYKALIANTVVCIIPFYNVGGGLNRGCCSRANQNGPKEYGFRGNIKNLDLNRDFIKCDSKNARAFINAYHICNPDIFIDTHTTNGADFQYTMSLIATQPDKLQVDLRSYLRTKMLPELYSSMKQNNNEIVPYVYPYKKTVESGLKDYLETPRYSTGYSTLFNSFGFVTEALKYKPYKNRVECTYDFLMTALIFLSNNKEELQEQRNKAINSVKQQETYPLRWTLDTATFSQIEFKGYEAEYVESKFGEKEELLIYNHQKPYIKPINYYNKYNVTLEIEKPKAYIIPQAYSGVINRLKWNKVEMHQLKNDTLIDVEVYAITDYKTVKQPYEGHYLHYSVAVNRKKKVVQYYKGDYVVMVNQNSNRYIVETLEPQGMDSFFAWNFFDGILQQKEWYSSFSFEKTATEILDNNKALKEEFEQKKKEDVGFAKSRNKQLYFVYTHSDYYEDTHNQYPVGRLVD